MSSELRIEGAVDIAHPALPDLIFDEEPTDHRGNLRARAIQTVVGGRGERPALSLHQSSFQAVSASAFDPGFSDSEFRQNARSSCSVPVPASILGGDVPFV